MESNTNNSEDIISASTCLLLAVSKADNVIDKGEINIIKNIIIDFFNLNNDNIMNIINNSIKKLNSSTDIYEFGKVLNNNFSYQDKIDFICCAFEVSFIDNESHYLEEHIIKKIAYILNVERNDLIKSKIEMKKIFKL